IDAIRGKYPQQKIWAIFEPRSNTSKRALFQNDFAKALARADEIILANVFMPEKVKEGPVLNVSELNHQIETLGKPSTFGLEVDGIVDLLQQKAKKGDVLLVMSNGGFGNIHQKLLERLA
ncbi:MAG: UDP-N-acetylmuramate:L-alanyl-gamma-D-glutamyl-meso-diaminopimelate ligase, partial [Deltaproteobacteria bacterium]|nr:UDP-N-acetylmuramate:L-alanyl-gamma-D-glutamyl-meso-diaminopimelate ligase [Deltaproteobacteria bacterium]